MSYLQLVRSIVFALLFTVFYISSMLRESYIYRNYGFSGDFISVILKTFAYVFIVCSSSNFLVCFVEQI